MDEGLLAGEIERERGEQGMERKAARRGREKTVQQTRSDSASLLWMMLGAESEKGI